MKILSVGDVVGNCGIAHLERTLRAYRAKEKIDFVIVNGENATDIYGLSHADAERIFRAGADLITLGNHAYGDKDLFPVLDGDAPILRPANYPPENPGRGYDIFSVDGWRILCISVAGRVGLDPLADPFLTVENILSREDGNFDFAVLDIHAEATSEKAAIGRVFDGKIAVMFGTHTHIPTADVRIFPGGSGFVTDLGMCGAEESIIGSRTEEVIARFRTMIPRRFHAAEGKASADAVLFTVSPEENRTLLAERVKF